MLQAQFFQPTTFTCCSTLSGLSLVPFMAAGKACLPVNYLTDEVLQYRFTCLVLLMIFALSPLMLHCPSVEHLSNLPQVCNLHSGTVKLYMEGFYENQTGLSQWEPWQKSKTSMTFFFWNCAMYMWTPHQWAEETCHWKVQVYKPRIM